MSNRQTLKSIRKALEPHISSNSFDSQVLSALIDELSGRSPQGTADTLEQRLHARTGYTFPQSKEIGELFSSVKEGVEHVATLRADRTFNQ